ncbi:MAG: oxaloacetate decarboxylase [Bacteroidota bacterium]|nr:oxaloacetate decarboxylase [Bacteroidota bacterium]MDP3433309.1 oxaloacetate decarboxylase [Bacteroidota bacterium]
MSEMGVALELLGVGLITVFVILALVVVLGTFIIRFVNKFFGEEIKNLPKSSGIAIVAISSKKLAAIVSAVSTLTKGTGRVTNVEKN